MKEMLTFYTAELFPDGGILLPECVRISGQLPLDHGEP
jgi:hypothetical protein